MAGSPSQRGTRPRIVSTAAGFQCVSGVSSPLMTAVLARIGVLGGLAPRRGSARRTRPRRGVALQFTAVVEARAGRVEVIEPQSRRPKAKLGLLYLKCDNTGLSASRKAVSAANIAMNTQARLLRPLLEFSRATLSIFHHNSIMLTHRHSTLLYAGSFGLIGRPNAMTCGEVYDRSAKLPPPIRGAMRIA